ncbi:MAG: DEAD/DEAH box helicase, partial [Myxococcales bacterium]|nr:DEAD/DEAH box helicase [Myxococcales bacterium]
RPAPSPAPRRGEGNELRPASPVAATRTTRTGARLAWLGYRFTRRADKLALGRVVVEGGDERPLGHPLLSAAARGERGAFEPTQVDFQIERLLESWRLAALPADRVAFLLDLLADARDVRLEGEPVVPRSAPLAPLARLVERDKALVLRIEPPAGATPVIPGIGLLARAGQPPELRPLGAILLAGSRWEQLPVERSFGPEEVSELVGDVLPALERQGVALEIKTRRFERRFVEVPPRLVVEVAQEGGALTVRASLVYGDPPCARIDPGGVRDAGRLVHLRGPIPKRDERAERRLCATLEAELGLSPGKRRVVEGDEAARYAKRLRAFCPPAPPAPVERVRGEARTTPSRCIVGDAHLRLYPDAPLAPEIALAADGRLAARFVLGPGARPSAEDADAVPLARGELAADPERVLAAWEAGQSLVALDGGGWAPLPHDWLARHGHRLAELLAARAPDGAVSPHARPALLAFADELELPRPPALAGLAPLVDGFEALPEPTLPDDLRAELRPYQLRGVAWLSFLRQAGLGAVLADDMGLGKTLQVLCALRRGERALVVCPTSVVHGWASEIARFRPALRVALYRGVGRELDRRADIVVTSYAIVRLDIERLAAEHFHVCVLDEAQGIKNPDSQVARAAYRLDAEFRIALSGTPIENRLEELWSMLHYTNPGLLGGRSSFEATYGRPILAGDADALARLRAKIRPMVLRRTKKEVLSDLPPKTESVLWVELDEGERAVYETVLAATREELVSELGAIEGGRGNVLAVLEALLRLRQAACHAGLVPGQHAERSTKVALLREALEEACADGHKALVFSQWTSLLDKVEPELREAGIDFVRLDGSTRDRGAVVGRFQDAAGPPVMLVSLKAGGTGLNLTAADHVFLLDPWWNPAVEDQAADRAHRIGQDRPVVVYRLVAKDTIEERVLALGARKRALADAALEGTGRAAALGREDLLALLA